MVWLPFFFFFSAARSLRLDEDVDAPDPPILTTTAAAGIRPCSLSDFFICSSFDDLMTNRLATQVICTSSSLDTSTSKAWRMELSGSSSWSTTSCTFFLPSIRSFKEHAVGSTYSSSSSSTKSSSSTDASVSNCSFARSASSFLFLAAVAISLRFFWIHLSMQSLATTSGATLITFLPFPRIISEPDFAKPTLFRTPRAFELLVILDAIILFSRLTFRYFCS
mmetsp:Transcript_97904/g.274113  ORF Transcript_97904/g.274113 Transcript_97904/m.274113 type:complete len:222 (+) Transcript_97904:270-935(+)